MNQTRTARPEQFRIGAVLLRTQRSACWSIFIAGPLTAADRQEEIVTRFKEHVRSGSDVVGHARFELEWSQDTV